MLRRHLKYIFGGKSAFKEKNVKIKYLEKFATKDARKVNVSISFDLAESVRIFQKVNNSSSHGLLVPMYTELK